MRKSQSEKCYNYIATYVDDLLISMKNPQEIIAALHNRFKFKLKVQAL